MRRFAALFLGIMLLLPTSVAAKQPCGNGKQPSCPPPGPVGMGRLFTFGAETGDFTAEGLIVGLSTFSTAIVRSGSKSFRTDETVHASCGLSFTGATARDYYARAYIYVDVAPTADRTLLSIEAAGITGIQINQLASDRSVQVLNMLGGSGVVLATAPALNLGQWYRIELHIQFNTGASDDTVEVRIDGSSIFSTTTASVTTTAPNAMSFNQSSSNTGSGVFYADDAALNDGLGSFQNTWPGDGAIVLLKPTALSAGGLGWTDDNAASTGAALLNAVDNTPPNGIADTTSGGGNHQDRNATANASSNLDMTMTTYTAAGVPAGATINVIDPITATAAPVATSAKAGTVGVVSNPAITNISLAAGGTSGAFWSGTAAGTYPTGWKISHGTITYGSSVTLGTAPVMRVTQVTSSTRIAMVAFMGMYVDYTPAIAANPPFTRIYKALLGQ